MTHQTDQHADVVTVIVVALAVEAQPIVQALGLKADPQQQPFRSFFGNNCYLVVSGIGKVMAGAACGWIGARVLAASKGIDPTICWINAGICGHASVDVGSVVSANAISDQASQRRFYPPNIHKSCPGTEIVTVDQPERGYTEDCGFDMEASAFWQIATRFSTSELCAVLKVVSDGPDDALESLDRARIRQLSTELVMPVQQTLHGLTTLAQPLKLSSQLQRLSAELCARCHFTATRQRQLRKTLTALDALGRLPQQSDPVLMKHRDAGAVIAQLQSWLGQAPVTLDAAVGELGSNDG